MQHHIGTVQRLETRDVVLPSLFQNQRILEYDILAIQEPWRNPFIATTYHPLKGHFHLTYLDNDATRVCFYIHKRIDPGAWNVSCISKDIISLSLRNSRTDSNINIVNVYEVETNILTILARETRRMPVL